jgi:integrase
MSYQPNSELVPFVHEGDVLPPERKKKPKGHDPRRDYLDDRKMKALKPDPDRKHNVVWDTGMPGMCVRISAKRQRAFYVVKRRHKDENPVWHKLGVYPILSLAQARERTREVLAALEKGENPRALAEAKRRATLEAERETFRAVAERYLRHLAISEEPPRPSSVRMYRSFLNNWLYPELGERPITGITRKDVIDTLDKAREQSGASTVLGAKGLLSAILNWAADRSILTVNPAAGIKAKTLVGRRAVARNRVLDDAELAAVWRAIPAVGEPFGSVYRLLLLTGLRLNEVAAAHWSDIDLDKGELNIPATRSKNGLAQVVPLPPMAVEIIKEVPRFDGFVFTTTHGRRPVHAGHAKVRIDAALKAAGVTIAPWVVHDFRRVVRTNLTALGVKQEVGEAVLNHKKRSLDETYNKYEYYDEKKSALADWETRLRSVVGLTPAQAGNVLPLRATP